MTHIDLSTVQGRYLLYVYAGVWLIQGGYLAHIVHQWLRTNKRSGR